MVPPFEFVRRLGSGYFGEVWLAINTRLDAECALKCIPPEKIINQSNFFQEAQILKTAEHENIVKILNAGRLKDGRIYVAMEYLEKRSLEEEASGAYVDLTRAKRIMIDVLRGLQHAHSKKIIHRDIKPANILIGNAAEGKLADFGLALPDLSTLDLSSIKQNYQYWRHLAPEVRFFRDYTYVSDIYACGITLYRLVNGDSYLPQLTFNELRPKTINGTFPNRKLYREFVPRSLKLVINKALNVDPAQRFQSAEEMRHALEQVEIFINWGEKMLSNGKRWRSSFHNICYEVRRIEEKNNWKVEVKKGKFKTKLRRIHRLCHRNLTKKDAEKITRKILQDYVTGKEK